MRSLHNPSRHFALTSQLQTSCPHGSLRCTIGSVSSLLMPCRPCAMQALALSWYSKPYDWEFDDWNDNEDLRRPAPPAKLCPLTLAAVAKRSQLRSLLLNGGKSVYLRQLPAAWSTALQALSSLELQVMSVLHCIQPEAHALLC